MSKRRQKPAPVISLVKRRMSPKENSWSPVELLEELLSEIKSGKLELASLMVCFTTKTESGGRRPHTWSSGVGHAEGIALAAVEMQRAIEDWRENP